VTSHICYAAGVEEARIPVRELRNNVSAVLRRVEAGESLLVTVDGRPVARLVPLRQRRRFVPAAELARMLEKYSADPGLLDDLRDVYRYATDDLNY